jgi:hypothetical protein
MAIGTSSGSRTCDPMRPACRTERRGSRSHAIYGGRTGRRRQGRAAGNPLGQDRRILDHLEKLGAFTPNRSGFPIVEVPLAPTPTTWPGRGASCSTGWPM